VSLPIADRATSDCGALLRFHTIFSVRDDNTADQNNESGNFGALLTSDCQPTVAAGHVARHRLSRTRILDQVG
jgi:hypothetical protein